MQRIRRQSSVNAGIIMIVLGALFIGILAAIFIYFIIKEQSMPPKEDDIDPVLVGGNGYYYESSSNKGFFSSGLFLAPLLFLLPISAFCIGIGIWNIINGRRSNEVKAKGTKSTCLVKKVVRHIYYRRHMPKYSVELEYQGQSGEKHILSLYFNAYRFEDIKEGERYECLVYQDDCYFDIDNPVQIKDSDIEY